MPAYFTQSWGTSTIPAVPPPDTTPLDTVPPPLSVDSAGDVTAQGSLHVTKIVASAGIANISSPAVTTPGVPAASTPVTNNTGYDVMVYVTGGAGVNVSVNGTATGLASGGFYVNADGTISLGAYTTAPTWQWVAV